MKPEDYLLYQNAIFSIEQCYSCRVPGYLMVRSKPSASSMALLSTGQAAQLGSTLRLAVRAVEQVLNPLKVYVAQFGEEDSRLHFHVFPRTKRITEEYLEQFTAYKELIHGPLLLDWAREKYRRYPVTDEVMRVMKDIKNLLRKGAQ